MSLNAKPNTLNTDDTAKDLTYASSDENYYLNLSLSVKISVYTYLQILMLLLFFKQWPELEQRGGV